MDEWMKMIEDGQREDEIRNNWQKRIDGGLKGIKRFQVIFEMKSGGVSISEYVVPFEKDQMKNDIESWRPICSKISKVEKPF